MIKPGDAVYVEGQKVSMFVQSLSRRRVYLTPARPVFRTGSVMWTIGNTSAPRNQVSRIESGKGGVRYRLACTFQRLA